MTFDQNDPFDGLPLATLDEKGEPPKARLTKASTLRAIFTGQRDDDRLSAGQRAVAQDNLDGGTPFDQSELDEEGMSDVTNLNFGGMAQQLERAVAPLYRLFSNAETLVSVSTTYGADEDREDYNTIIAEEITRTIRKSPSIPFQTKKLMMKSVFDAVGVLFWQDDLDWRYRGSGLGHFFFDRQVDLCEEDLECPTAYEEFSITRLWKCIRNKEAAEKNGWDYDACIEAIKKATSAVSPTADWERQLEEIKNNDLGAPRGAKIPLIHGWVEEFDGTVSHYITTEEDHGTESFLYASQGKYDEMRQALVLFPWGLGTNSKLHGARGMGYKIFPFENQRDRSLSRLIDQGEVSSSIMVQAEDETAMASVGMQYYGNLAVISPGAKLVQNYVAPDLQRTVMPVLQEMERLRNERMAGLSTQGVFDGTHRKTAEEISAHLDQAAELSDSQLDFFEGPFERALIETVRRMSRRGYIAADPGGKEIMKLQKRLQARGVPLQALWQLDHDATTMVRTIGAGSSAARTRALSRMEQLRGRMDDVGQANLDRDLAVDAVRASNADRYFPKDGMKRTTLDTNIAILETQMLVEGREIPVLSSDKHLAHAREHMKPMVADFQMVQSGQMEEAEFAQLYALLYGHTAEHVDTASGDVTVEEETAMMRQMMQQIGEPLANGLKALEAERQKAEEEGESAAMPDDGGKGAEMILKHEEHRERMRMEREAFDLKQQMKMEESEVKQAIQKAEAATKIRVNAKTKTP
jgi:hypothetical protein